MGTDVCLVSFTPMSHTMVRGKVMIDEGSCVNIISN